MSHSVPIFEAESGTGWIVGDYFGFDDVGWARVGHDGTYQPGKYWSTPRPGSNSNSVTVEQDINFSTISTLFGIAFLST